MCRHHSQHNFQICQVFFSNHKFLIHMWLIWDQVLNIMGISDRIDQQHEFLPYHIYLDHDMNAIKDL